MEGFKNGSYILVDFKRMGRYTFTFFMISIFFLNSKKFLVKTGSEIDEI